MIAPPALADARTVALHRVDDVDYQHAQSWQLETATKLQDARLHAACDESAAGYPVEAGETLALIQHRPVFTLGTAANASNVLTPIAELAARGAEVIPVDRGGDVTFHGPGQLVAYPILDLHARAIRPVDYVRLLEQTVIDTLATFNLAAERIRGRPGVWVNGAKVAAVGVRVQRGISRHGVALNVDTDLTWFDAIIPCGIADAEVTSMSRLLPAAPPFEAVVTAYRAAFEHRFASHLVEVDDTPFALRVPTSLEAVTA
jgi:lipoyl(octanoyl) transferase